MIPYSPRIPSHPPYPPFSTLRLSFDLLCRSHFEFARRRLGVSISCSPLLPRDHRRPSFPERPTSTTTTRKFDIPAAPRNTLVRFSVFTSRRTSNPAGACYLDGDRSRKPILSTISQSSSLVPFHTVFPLVIRRLSDAAIDAGVYPFDSTTRTKRFVGSRAWNGIVVGMEGNGGVGSLVALAEGVPSARSCRSGYTMHLDDVRSIC